VLFHAKIFCKGKSVYGSAEILKPYLGRYGPQRIAACHETRETSYSLRPFTGHPAVINHWHLCATRNIKKRNFAPSNGR
jgi:hypothetical protein